MRKRNKRIEQDKVARSAFCWNDSEKRGRKRYGKSKQKDIDLDITVVQIKLLVKGSRNYITINCPVGQVIEFTDYLNANKAVVHTKREKEMMENRYYVFDDIVKENGNGGA